MSPFALGPASAFSYQALKRHPVAPLRRMWNPVSCKHQAPNFHERSILFRTCVDQLPLKGDEWTVMSAMYQIRKKEKFWIKNTYRSHRIWAQGQLSDIRPLATSSCGFARWSSEMFFFHRIRMQFEGFMVQSGDKSMQNDDVPAMKSAISRLGAIRTWRWRLGPQARRWWLTSRHPWGCAVQHGYLKLLINSHSSPSSPN